MNKIKTLQIGLEWFPERGGGLDRYYHDLVNFGQSDTMECTGLVVGSGRSDAETKGRIHSFADPSATLVRRLISARKAVREQLTRNNPDIVVAHFAMHIFPALDLIEVPLIVHFHGPWTGEAMAQQGNRRWISAAQKFIEQKVYRRADRLIVLSNSFKDLLHEQYGIPKDRISVVPGSIDVARFSQIDSSREDSRKALGWPVDRRILLSVRRLVRRMGLEQVIQAISSLVNDFPDILLLIAGRGPEEAKLNDLIIRLGLENNVKLLGFIEDAHLPSAYRAANCSIVPTLTLEGFGLIVAESLASGTPSLVTPVGGLPEVVNPLSSKLVFRGSDSTDIAFGLRCWLNGELEIPDEAACRIYARNAFSWSVGIENLASQYRSALQ